MAMFRRLALGLLLLATGAHAGILKNALGKITSMFGAGAGCDKVCLAKAYARGELLFSKVDSDKDGYLSRTEYAEMLRILFRLVKPEDANKEFEQMCARQSCKPEVGIQCLTLRYVFQHAAWRDRLNKRVEDGEL
mmetsp:Transcript_37167/g.107077  ORF Transcript_37167/g.107077 Transcript_37167/m.107077 type:complete len:135 (+) Transcript_37167:80-484(+)